MEQKPGGVLQKQPTSETEHEKYCKLVMPEFIVIISPVILHTRHVNYILHSLHKSHVKYSLTKEQNETLLFSLLIWFFKNACLD